MTNARHALIQALFALTYDVDPKRPRSKCRSSYGLKHDMERAFHDKFYVSNSETILALKEIGVPSYEGDPNLLFKIKPKFPLSWLHLSPDARRPKYESKTQWAAYSLARQEIEALRVELEANAPPDTSSFSRLASVVGYANEGTLEVPACLTARLTKEPTTASGSP